MRNEYMNPATELSLPVVAGTQSGDPVRHGVFNGVAATSRGEGGNVATHATVLLDNRAYTFNVDGAIAGPGSPVWLTPRDEDTAPSLSTTDPANGAAPWGHTIPKVGETGVRAATSGVTVVRPAQV